MKCSSIVHRSAHTALRFTIGSPHTPGADLYGFPWLNTVSQRGFDYVIPPSANTALPFSGFLLAAKTALRLKSPAASAGGRDNCLLSASRRLSNLTARFRIFPLLCCCCCSAQLMHCRRDRVHCASVKLFNKTFMFRCPARSCIAYVISCVSMTIKRKMEALFKTFQTFLTNLIQRDPTLRELMY